MRVLQPIELVLGLSLTGLLVWVLGVALYQAIAKPGALRRGIGTICLCVALGLSGPRGLSEAFDPPSHWSHRTEIITVAVLLLQVVLMSFYVLDRRRRKRAARDAGTAEADRPVRRCLTGGPPGHQAQAVRLSAPTCGAVECLWGGGRYTVSVTLAEGIQAKVAAGEFEFSRHAAGQLAEDYPDDKYGPICLLPGHTQGARPLHAQCSDPARPPVKIITVYHA